MAHKDKLNLAGLLEVLDGVVDCPNRLVVMTSNHPEVKKKQLRLPQKLLGGLPIRHLVRQLPQRNLLNRVI
jgi:chaperone BCS1